MTILAFPTSDFSGIDVNPEHVIAMTRARGNLISEVRSADPMWIGSLTTTALSARQLAQWEAYISRVSDELILTDFVHPLYRCPSAYTVSSFSALSWPGATGIAEINSFTDLRTLVLSNVPMGMVLRYGDRCAVTEGGNVSYRMIAEDVTVAGATVTVKLTPRLPLGLFSTAAQVKFLNPPIRCRVMKNSWSAPLVAGEGYYGSFDIFEAAHEDA
jgi:hypothetical protein